MSEDGYSTVRLPEELIKEVDKIVADSKWGFKTRAEFVKEAVRQHLLRVKEQL